MKILILICGLLAVSPAFAMKKNVEIDSKLIVKGKKLGSPRIVTLEGEKAKVMLHDQKNQTGYNLEFRPILLEGKKVLLKYAVAVRESGNEIISRGELQIPYDKKGRISIDKGSIQIHFKVKRS